MDNSQNNTVQQILKDFVWISQTLEVLKINVAVFKTIFLEFQNRRTATSTNISFCNLITVQM